MRCSLGVKKGVAFQRLPVWCLVACVLSVTIAFAADEVGGRVISGPITWLTTVVSADTRTTVRTVVTSDKLAKESRIELIATPPMSVWFGDESGACTPVAETARVATIVTPKPPLQYSVCVSASGTVRGQVLAGVSQPGKATTFARSPVIEFTAAGKKSDPILYAAFTGVIGLALGFLSAVLSEWWKYRIEARRAESKVRVDAQTFLHRELLGEMAKHRTMLTAFVAAPAQWVSGSQNALPLPALDDMQKRAEELAGYFVLIDRKDFAKQAQQYGDQVSQFNVRIQTLVQTPQPDREYKQAVKDARSLLQTLKGFGFK